MITYSEVSKNFRKTANLLVGNGFSVACGTIFLYANLYEKAVRQGLSPRAQKIFEKWRTNNFEAAMRVFDDGNWISGLYGLADPEKSTLWNELKVLNNTLIEVIASSHILHSGMIEDKRKENVSAFFDPYTNSRGWPYV